MRRERADEEKNERIRDQIAARARLRGAVATAAVAALVLLLQREDGKLDPIPKITSIPYSQ